MFQPETEDMLPRMAPKPSSAMPLGATEAIIRPQVPEVSILFGAAPQEGITNPQMPMQQTQPPPSYSAWKKQVLPKVVYPPGLALDSQINGQDNDESQKSREAYNLPRSSLFPLRAAVTPVVSMGMNVGNCNTNVYGNGSGQTQNVYSGNNNVMNNPSCFRRSLESCIGNNNFQPPPQASYRPIVESTPPTVANGSQTSSRDVLTICAGTQTESMGSPTTLQQNNELNLEIKVLKQMVQEIRQDQIRLMQFLETFMYSQKLNAGREVDKVDAAVQVKFEGKDSSPPPLLTNGNGPNAAPYPVAMAPTNKFLEHLKPNMNLPQTPKGKPMAQSTTYRPNTPPQINRMQQINSPPPAPPPLVNYQPQMEMAKTTNDKSLVMNELALKYLPNEKLVELLKELNIAQPLGNPGQGKIQMLNDPANCPTTPLRNIENFERNPTDISNASYKYLKKYRLLPEDQEEAGDEENVNPNQQQYEGGRNSPQFQQRQQPKANSPYQQQQQQQQNLIGRLPTSPLVTASPPPPPQYRDMLNLENIKQQPKFL